MILSLNKCWFQVHERNLEVVTMGGGSVWLNMELLASSSPWMARYAAQNNRSDCTTKGRVPKKLANYPHFVERWGGGSFNVDTKIPGKFLLVAPQTHPPSESVQKSDKGGPLLCDFCTLKRPPPPPKV